ncbi:HEPN domain-containing protein [Pseudomonas mediterranea]|uniref:HEPN domain-containing protein n=1 Tax=Pseudomonas mediterranea TaxID=183795 RepID=UPI0006D8CFAD|nr:HEPN domain-containing protein [Pseudomonas mediterranea]
MANNKRIYLNEALDCFTLNPGTDRLKKRSYYYGRDELAIIDRDRASKFYEVVSKILDGGVGRIVSRKFLEQRVARLIYMKLKEGLRFTEAEAASFKKELSALTVLPMRVIREVHGACISPYSAPVKFGRFTFYDWKRHFEVIKSEAGVEAYEGLVKEDSHSLVVGCTVECHDQIKGLELAGQEFVRLEHLITFMIGRRDSGYEFGIVHYNGLKQFRTYYSIGDESGLDSTSEGAFNTLNLDDEFFISPSAARLRLMHLDEAKANGLELKILKSVEWLSQALIEKNPASAFIKASTALEVLFAINEKGVVSSSMMAKFSEACAQILGGSPSQCITIEKEIKRLYAVRSAVVHSGKSDVSLSDLDHIIFYVRQVVLRILEKEPFSGFTSIKLLDDYLSELKYHRNSSSNKPLIDRE